MEKILTCKVIKIIIKNEKIAKQECYYLSWKGNCNICPNKEYRDFKDLPDLIKEGYKTPL